MTLIIRLASIIIVTLNLINCGGMINKHAGPAPDWVNGDSSSYPGSVYLTAVGHERYLKAAKRNATGELMQRFDPEPDPSLKSLNTKETETLTQTLIQGIEKRIQIVDTWYNKENSHYYVLAIIHKKQAAEDLKKHIKALDGASGTHIDKTGSSRDKLMKIFHAGNALYQQTLREHYAGLLKTMDSNSGAVRQIWTIGSLRNSFNKLLNRIFVQVNIINDDMSVLRSSLNRSLRQLGLAEASGNYVDYVLECSLNVEDETKEKNRHIFETIVSLRLLDAQRRSHGEKSWPLIVKSTADDRKSLVEAGTTAIDSLLKRELLSTLLEFSNRD